MRSAYAMLTPGDVVVAEEGAKTSRRNAIKIPKLCKAFDVECINLATLMRDKLKADFSEREGIAPDSTTASRYARKPEGDPEATEAEEEGQAAAVREASSNGDVRVRECAGDYSETEG